MSSRVAVQGAGYFAHNGEYVKVSPTNFVHTNKSGSRIWFCAGPGIWFIGDPGGHGGKSTYMAFGGPGQPPSRGWQPADDGCGVLPLPSVEDVRPAGGGREQACPQAVAVEGAGLPEVNGVYLRDSDGLYVHWAMAGALLWYSAKSGAWCVGVPSEHDGKGDYHAFGERGEPPTDGWHLSPDTRSIHPPPRVRREVGEPVAHAQDAEGGEEAARELAAAADAPRPGRLWLLCAGSRGDIQPFCALGRRLIRRGHRVRCCTNDGFQGFVESSGMAFTKICINLENNEHARLFWHTVFALAASRPLAHMCLAAFLGWAWQQEAGDGWLVHCCRSLASWALAGALAPFLCCGLARVARTPGPMIRLSTSVAVEVAACVAGAAAERALGRTAGLLTWLLAVLGLTLGGLVGRNIVGLVDMFVDYTCPTAALLALVKREPPDAIICQNACSDLGIALSARLGVPLVLASLMPCSLLSKGPLKEADYERAVAREKLLLSPAFGARPIAAMGCAAWLKIQEEEQLCAVPRALATDRQLVELLGLAGVSAERGCSNKVLPTGVWGLDEGEEQELLPDMFGGPDARARLEAFVGGGAAPVYIGWGSMTSRRGPREMCRLAVGALRGIGRRGVVLGGWARLNADLLTGNDPETRALRAYAEKNVAFVDRAPHSWLLPRCSCAVIHGGIGTLFACWRAGVPTIVTPVIADQPYNGVLGAVVGSGLLGPSLNDCSSDVLGGLIQRVTGTPAYKSQAARLRGLMLRDSGVTRAALHVEGLLQGRA